MRALADKMHSKTKVAALDVSGVPDLEYTALKMLIEAGRGNANAECRYGWWGSTRTCFL